MNEAGTIGRVLAESRVVAVVGLSDNPQRPSYRVARYLQSHGYRVIPVNPTLPEVLGEKSYPDLDAVPGPVDVVDIFRREEEAPAIVEAAIRKGAWAVWMQEGVVNETAARRARAAGVLVVMDRCMLKEHSRWAAG